MSYSDIFDQRNNAYGNGIADARKTSFRNKIVDTFKDSPSYYSVLINGVSTDSHIVDDSETREQKILYTQSTSPLKSGDLVQWNNQQWITLITDNMSDVYYRGTIRKCVSSLKWLDSGVEKEAFFTLRSDVASNFGVEDGRIVSIGNERRQIIIQSNVDTQKIVKDQWFIFDKRKWRVTSIDGLTEGLIGLTLEEDIVNEVIDDTQSRIADNTENVGGMW